ncbi:MAG TPA: hypothetical protein PLS53_07470 [Thermoanaerobaculaceae bacterium]|nr:hypothetical protein [Thermoanaerobaculaceae bacterium]
MHVEPGAGTEESGGRWGRGLAVALAMAVQLMAVNYWPAFPSPAERPRVYQALAVVHRGSLDIDREIGCWGGSEDVAAFAGRRFPNKAPGLLPLLLPGAALAHLTAPCGSQAELRAALVLGRLAACSLPLWVTLALLRRLRGATEWLAWAWALASPAWAASLLLFSHALTASLLLAGFVLLHEAARSRRHDALAGMLLGWAVACEYPLAVPAAVLVLAVTGPGRWRRWLAIATGAVWPAAGLGAYNWACFGSPWSLSSAHEAHTVYASLLGSGVFGIGAPTPGGLFGVLVSPTRGLLVWFPLLLLGAAALPWARERLDRAERVAGLAGLGLVVVMAGYRNWHGGWFPGPRYLLAVLPLLLVAVAPGVGRLRCHVAGRLALAAVALWGVTASWLGVVSFPFPPEDMPLPFLTLTPTLLADGITFPSWGGGAIWLAALGIAALAGAWAVLRKVTAQRAERLLSVLVVTMILVAAVRLVHRPATWQARLEHAVISEVYCGVSPPVLLPVLRRGCDTPERCRQVEEWLAQTRADERKSSAPTLLWR